MSDATTNPNARAYSSVVAIDTLPLFERVRARTRATVDAVLGYDLFEVAAAMTLVMLVLSMHDPAWEVRLGIATLSVSALIVRPLMRNPLLWLGLVVVLGVTYVLTWYNQNNHDFLKLYWCLGVGLSLLLADPERALKTNARWLIGLCFLFAFVWKLLSPEYADHSFFNYFLLQDVRFNLISEHLLGLDGSALTRGQLDRVAYTTFGDPAVSVPVPLAEGVRWMAPIMSWWTLFVEGAVALTFLIPTRFKIARLRDPLLLVFILSTYFVAPILYFAWLLIAMGLVQCDRTSFRYWPLGYLAAFLLILMRFYVPV